MPRHATPRHNPTQLNPTHRTVIPHACPNPQPKPGPRRCRCKRRHCPSPPTGCCRLQSVEPRTKHINTDTGPWEDGDKKTKRRRSRWTWGGGGREGEGEKNEQSALSSPSTQARLTSVSRARIQIRIRIHCQRTRAHATLHAHCGREGCGPKNNPFLAAQRGVETRKERKKLALKERGLENADTPCHVLC